jgi:hypothetical protein
MKWAAAVTGFLVWAAATAAYGDPLAGAALPADTRWVIHMDVDAARLATPLWDLAATHIVGPYKAQLAQPLAMLQRITNMKIPQDLRDVTLYGAAYDGETDCIVIHGKVDAVAVVAFFRSDREFRQVDHNGHPIMTWRDTNRDRLTYTAFADNNCVIISPSSKVVEDALDVRDGKMSALKPDSPLVPADATPASSRTPILWLAGRNLADLQRTQKAETPLLSVMESASLSLRWANDRLVTETQIQAKSDEAATRLKAVADGIKALVLLMADDDHAPAHVRQVADAIQSLTVEAKGKTVTGEWSIDIGKIETVVNQLVPTPAAATAPGPAKTLP